MTQEMQRLTAKALNMLDQLEADVKDGNEEAISDAREVLHEMVDYSSPEQLIILFLGPKIAAEMYTKGETK